jgi:protocatechuate 3,4-dioxygenase beta subunit
VTTRREALAAIAASGATLLTARPLRAATGAMACAPRPQQTEGPFFVEEDLNRGDIRTDPRTGVVTPGVPLQLSFKVSHLAGAACAPLEGARVDVWQCDARGRYSETGRRMGDERRDADTDKFLRGYQRTDASGAAQFLTIYPGGYEGRAVHIHFKIRTAAAGTREFTSQLYFDDALTDRVHGSAPYAAHRRSMRNDDDFLFRDGGTRLLLDLAPAAQGYAATFDVALQLA